MVVAGDKTDLLVVGTLANRRSKLKDQKLEILVDGKVVSESSSKKLLGVIMNNTLTWKDRIETLITQLSQRAGLLQNLSSSASRKKLQMFASGIFYSKLEYCLPLFVNTWGLDQYNENEEKYVTMTKEQCRKLQVLQNKVCRLMLPRSQQDQCRLKAQHISTSDLLKTANVLSIHQLGAYSTILLAKKIMMDKKPIYLANQLMVSDNSNTRRGALLTLPRVTLGASRESFIYRAVKLRNRIPGSVWQEPSMMVFKKKLFEWTRANIAVKP